MASGIVIAPDEKKIMEFEGEYRYASVSSILGMFTEFMTRIMVATKLWKQWAHVVVTDKRVTMSIKNIACFCITLGQDYKNLIPRTLVQVGFIREPLIPFCPCCCHMYYLYFDYEQGASVYRSFVRIPGADEATAAKTADAVYRALVDKN